MVTLHHSGKGVTPLDIESVRQLAISLGYTFEGEDDLAKKADLGGIAADTSAVHIPEMQIQ